MGGDSVIKIQNKDGACGNGFVSDNFFMTTKHNTQLVDNFDDAIGTVLEVPDMKREELGENLICHKDGAVIFDKPQISLCMEPLSNEPVIMLTRDINDDLVAKRGIMSDKSHSCKSVPGDSGAPIFSVATQKLVGVNYGSIRGHCDLSDNSFLDINKHNSALENAAVPMSLFEKVMEKIGYVQGVKDRLKE
eukprot:TRINITY_DN57_c0_g1_i8.p2 TRINITY_DN57_c0_g1~~TRINITY_DN57_c0_g1_i8.p2  ORF type:complete len:210 (-),score=54.47 TRINITY_DN57_c0_g1_i8:1725-2297(-)